MGYLWEEERKCKTQIKSSDPAAQKRSELGDCFFQVQFATDPGVCLDLASFACYWEVWGDTDLVLSVYESVKSCNIQCLGLCGHKVSTATWESFILFS